MSWSICSSQDSRTKIYPCFPHPKSTAVDFGRCVKRDTIRFGFPERESLRTLHLAGGRDRGVGAGDLAFHRPAPAGSFLVEGLSGRERPERADVHVLEELVVALPQVALPPFDQAG